MTSDRFLIAVLKTVHTIDTFEDRVSKAGIELMIPDSGLFEAVLDELGVPPDETSDVPYEQIPNVFSRDWTYDSFRNIVTTGSEEECRKFIDTMREDIKEIETKRLSNDEFH